MTDFLQVTLISTTVAGGHLFACLPKTSVTPLWFKCAPFQSPSKWKQRFKVSTKHACTETNQTILTFVWHLARLNYNR